MVDPLGGAAGGFDSVHHQVLKTTSMAPPLGALLAGLTASITKVEDDVDGGPPGGCYRWVQQRPPLSLKTTSMACPLGVTTGGSNSIHHRV
jgi:hypothetical protein